jgi:hypothetical protein
MEGQKEQIFLDQVNTNYYDLGLDLLEVYQMIINILATISLFLLLIPLLDHPLLPSGVALVVVFYILIMFGIWL